MDHRRSASHTCVTTARDTALHTSSAFSASAQPNEDWTKISDLAERRRIQNRIAQRNYRKKLKKRLEDLERKAHSTSSSPEPQAEPEPVRSPVKADKQKSRSLPAVSSKRRPSAAGQARGSTQSKPAASVSDDWNMFTSQHTRQISTSPPPFAFPSIDLFRSPPSPQLPPCPYPISSVPSSDCSYQLQPSGMQPFDASFSFPAKQESFYEPDFSPLSLPAFLPPLNPIDLSFPSNFSDSSLTPELCDLYDYSSAGSPGEFGCFPQTPHLLPLSPPLHTFEQ